MSSTGENLDLLETLQRRQENKPRSSNDAYYKQAHAHVQALPQKGALPAYRQTTACMVPWPPQWHRMGIMPQFSQVQQTFPWLAPTCLGESVFLALLSLEVTQTPRHLNV